MRVYLSVDMEGVAGISHSFPTERGERGYPAAVAMMVGEANAAIEGAFEGGATDVVVNDSHGYMINLTPIDLDPRAILIQGQKPWSMIQGSAPQSGGDGEPFGVALFVGYHTRAGHPHGVISHTYSGSPTLTRLAGRLAGESAINAAVLGQWGIPVGLVSGDDALADETADWLPWAERVIVKRALSRRAAASVHPSVAGDSIRAAAARAVGRAAAGDLRPLLIDPPVTIEVEYRYGGEADYAAFIPGTERYGDRGVRISAPDAVTAYRTFLAGLRLVGMLDQKLD